MRMKKVLEKVAVVMLDVSTWSGRKALSQADRKRVGVQAPDEIVSIGHKKIVDPAEIAVFATLKKRAERLLYKNGVRFLGGYAVPLEKLDAVRQELGEIKAEYEKERALFSSRFTKLVTDWASAHKEWADMLNVLDTRPDESLRFNFASFAVTPSEGDTGTEQEVSAMGDRLFSEVATDIRYFWENNLKGRAEVTQKALRPIKSVLDKIEGLVFIDPRAIKVAEYIRSVLDTLPNTGPLDQSETAKIAGLALVLSQGDGAVPDIASSAQSKLFENKAAEAVETVSEDEVDHGDDDGADDMPVPVIADQQVRRRPTSKAMF